MATWDASATPGVSVSEDPGCRTLSRPGRVREGVVVTLEVLVGGLSFSTELR